MRISVDTLIKLFFASAVVGVGVSYSSLYLFHLVYAGVFLFYFSGYLKGLNVSHPTRYFQMIPLTLAWFFLSILWSWDRWASVIYEVYLLIGGGIVFIAVNYAITMQKQELVYRSIAFVICFELIASLLECTGYFRLPISPYSSYVHYFGREIAYDQTLEQAVLSQVLNTPSGFGWNPNNLGGEMVAVLPFFIFLKRSWFRLLGIIGVPIVIILSGSRGSVLAMFLVLFVYNVFYVKKTFSYWMNVILWIFSLGMLAIYFIDITFVFDAISALFEYVLFDSDSTDSIGIRQQLIHNGLEALKATYGLGVGGGADTKVQLLANNTFYGSASDDHQVLSMHNFWAELLVNGGVLFFVAFVVWYVKLGYELFHISKNTENDRLKYFASSSSLALVGFSVAAISASSVIYYFPTWLLLGFSIATINNYHRYIDQSR